MGPYRFTETDAQRTVGNLDAIWGLYAHDRDAGVLEPLYPTLTGDLATDLQRVWAAWCAAGPALRAAGQLPERAQGRWQALCLWSNEVIDALHAQGHPIAPGLAGENITISGLPWPDVRAGVRLRVGEVLCEVSAFALPCFQNKAWFTGGDFEAMHHERGPVSRVYATVLEPGTIAVGQPAILEP